MIQFGNKPLQSVIFGVLIDAINSLSNTLWQSAYRTFQNCNLASFIISHTVYHTVYDILFIIIKWIQNDLFWKKTNPWFALRGLLVQWLKIITRYSRKFMHKNSGSLPLKILLSTYRMQHTACYNNIRKKL